MVTPTAVFQAKKKSEFGLKRQIAGYHYMPESGPKRMLPQNKGKTSLILRLSIWYLTLTLINVMIFWVGTGSNQMRLISDKASMYARSSAFEALRRLQAQLDMLAISRRPVADFQGMALEFARRLHVQNIKGEAVLPQYSVYSTNGDRLLVFPAAASAGEVRADDLVAAAKVLQLRELKNEPFMAVPDLAQGQITVYLPLTANGDIDLILAGTLPMPELRGEIASLIRLGIAMVVMLVILQSAMAYLIYRTLVRPIKKVSEAATTVAKGTFATVDFKSRHEDEIAQLVESFNQMSDDLKTNREIMDFELNIARKIQSAILPQQLTVRQLTTTVHYNPLYTVSGDFYDIHELEDGSVAVFIADASGHGVPAAFLTIMAKIYFSDFVRENPQPSVVLSRMNECLAGYFEGAGLYMTAFYMRIFPDNRAVYCNGMHPEPILMRANGSHELLEASAFYVGMMKEVFKEFEDVEIKLHAGDQLVLYTDGFTEAKNNNDEEFTSERFVETIKTAATNEPAQLIRSALTEVMDFVGGAKRTDDETLIVCQVGDPVMFHTKKEGTQMQHSDEELSQNPHYQRKLADYVEVLSLGEPVRTIWNAAQKDLQEKDFVTALAGFNAIAEAYGNKPALSFRQALCYYRIRLYDACAVALSKCLAAAPENPDANALFSLLALKTNDLGKALHYIEKAVSGNPVGRYNGVLRKIRNGIVA